MVPLQGNCAPMDIQSYINEIRALHKSGQTTEHSFRPALSRLFESIDSDLTVINEPKHLTDVGSPDFVFNRNGISIGWCKEQKTIYTKGLPKTNLRLFSI